MRDVAHRAGVSQATVSYVLNGRADARISPATQQRVQEAAAALSYQPNAIARAMVSGRSEIVGVYQPHTGVSPLTGMWTTAVMRGISEVLHSYRYHLLLYGYRESEEPPPAVFLDGRVDGLIVLAPHLDDILPRQLTEARFPTAIIGGRGFEGTFTVSVDVDNTEGAYRAVSYLIGLGHRRIAHLLGPPCVPNALDRQAGYEQALRNVGLPFCADYMPQAGFDEEAGYRAARNVLCCDPAPTALFAANDVAALGALRACAECDLQVPKDVSIVGYDDSLICEISRPKLTTMRQPAVEMGSAAAESLLAMIAEGTQPGEKRRLFPAELVVRESSGPPSR